jgi:hypothetical protein
MKGVAMTAHTSTWTSSRPFSGWIIIGLMPLGFAGLYALNYLLPLRVGSYTTRIWDWAELSLAGLALLVLLFQWRRVRVGMAVIGAALALVSALSHGLHGLQDPGLPALLIEALAVWLTFTAGSALFLSLADGGVAAFRPPAAGIARNLGIGVLAAIPLVVVNNLYFYLQNGVAHFQSIWISAVEALRPGIHEEAIYRYFVLAVCLYALEGSQHPRLVSATAVALAVVPHSLLHLPDLFLDNPIMGIVMLAATSLLFGLPMALLQLKRSFESAVAFHWFIDFARFLFGY